MSEKTLVLIKPDAMKRKIDSQIIQNILSDEITLVAAKKIHPDKNLILSHYNSENLIKRHGPNIKSLINYFSSGFILALVFEGANVVRKIKKICGDKPIPKECEKTSIRYRYGSKVKNYYSDEGCIMNLVHSSSTPDIAKVEINLWFGDI